MQGSATSRAPLRGCARSAFAVAALLVLGCGCERKSKPRPAESSSAARLEAAVVASGVASADAAPAKSRCPRPDPGQSLIDDFEDGDSGTALFPGQGGSWFVATDKTKGGTVRPAPGPANPVRLEQQRCGSVFALHFSGSGLVEWGAVLAATFRYDQKTKPVDLTTYSGVVFWLRAGSGHEGVLRFDVDDAFTHRDGGHCDDSAGAQHRCWNSYGLDMPELSDEWQEHRIRFDSLAQKFPEAQPRPLDKASIHRMSFKASPGNPFDVWVDDFRLFR